MIGRLLPSHLACPILAAMFYLARNRYPDRIFDEDDLDAVADLWRAWYEKRRSGLRSHWVVYQFLEVRLWGFARDRGAALVDLLRKDMISCGLSDPPVALRDSDTISVASPAVCIEQDLPRGLWLDLFHDEEFAGLPLMLRLTISEYRDQPEGRPGDCAGLVLVGKLQDGRLQLKAIWPSSLEAERLDALFKMAVWPEETEFLQALDDFQRTGLVGSGTGGLFVSRGQEQVGYSVIRLLFDLPGQAKLPAFLGRVGFFAVPILVAAFLL
jgi:hypothetical protein